MAAIAYWMLYSACGVAVIRFLLPKKRPVVRVWLGLTLGLILMTLSLVLNLLLTLLQRRLRR